MNWELLKVFGYLGLGLIGTMTFLLICGEIIDFIVNLIFGD